MNIVISICARPVRGLAGCVAGSLGVGRARLHVVAAQPEEPLRPQAALLRLEPPADVRHAGVAEQHGPGVAGEPRVLRGRRAAQLHVARLPHRQDVVHVAAQVRVIRVHALAGHRENVFPACDLRLA